MLSAEYFQRLKEYPIYKIYKMKQTFRQKNGDYSIASLSNWAP
jgi:hypothetical protein